MLADLAAAMGASALVAPFVRYVYFLHMFLYVL